jgi:hypothetical protein
MGKERTAGSCLNKSQCIKDKKQIIVFFDSKGIICTNQVPKGAMVIGVDIKTELCRLVKALKKKKLDMAAGDLHSPELVLQSSPLPLCRTISRQ